jgi:hypothetical protein
MAKAAGQVHRAQVHRDQVNRDQVSRPQVNRPQVNRTAAKAPGMGHNSKAMLAKLSDAAAKQHRKANRAWAALTLAQIRHQSNWADILQSVVASGMAAEDLRSRFGIPPSTFSRWWTGSSEPARMLRSMLEREIEQVAEEIVKSTD